MLSSKVPVNSVIGEDKYSLRDARDRCRASLEEHGKIVKTVAYDFMSVP